MTIADHDIHIWCAFDEDIKDASLLSQYHDLLSEEERIKQKRFHFEKDRHQYLVTRALVRSVLSLYNKDISPDKWIFKKNDYGKPYIGNRPLSIPLCFNISHSKKIIVMAVTLGQEIGVDVEYLPRFGKMLDIANRFFSPSEVQHLFELPPERQRNRFFDLWTLKEAYIKACGMGLSIPLDHFSYSFSPQGQISIEFMPERNDHSDHWQFWQMQPNKFHKVSMALKGNEIDKSYSISIRKIEPLSQVAEVNYPVAHGAIIPD